MRSSAIRAAMLGLIVATGAIGALAVTPAQGAKLTAEEERWLDSRISDDERAVLDTIVGYAPPEFPDDLQWIETDELSLEDLRGKVVVIQSWTRKTVLGRAAPMRTTNVLKGYKPEDVQIIALHTPDGAEGIETYTDKRAVTVPVVVDASGAYCDELGAYDRPVTIVLDRNGAVRYAGLSITGLPAAVDKLVAEKYDANAAKPGVVASRDARDKQLGAGAPKAKGAPRRTGNGDFPPIQGAMQGATDLRGRKGPELFAQSWVTGEPETEGKVIVAEFWATWCGPCVRGIPHLNDLQAAFPNEVVVVGISDEPVSKVKPAVRSLNMKYTVATDPTRRMRGVIQNRGIPHAIVMSPDGIVRWQGHPYHLSEDILRQIVQASDLGVAAGAGGSSPQRWTQPSAS